MYGVTDGKAVGTFLEHHFKACLLEKYDFIAGNSAKGIDFPDLLIDMKVTSIKQPQSSCPFKSARQKIFGLGYSLIIFVYAKTDDALTKTARLNILHTIFVEAGKTADFQMTRGILNILNLELTEKICQKLINLGVKPDLILEPTCGIGNFLITAAKVFPEATSLIGIELNSDYIKTFDDLRITVKQGNFFHTYWENYLENKSGRILILGNFPWVTNSQQGVINSKNLPPKNNLKAYSGLDAITGKSNFDISEWMLIKMIEYLQNQGGYLGMLCKTSVSRKLLNFCSKKQYDLKQFAFYKIDMKKYFNVSVDAGLLFCDIVPYVKQYFCDVFQDLHTLDYQRIGYYQERLVNNLDLFKTLSYLYGSQSQYKWRSGIKHDCAKVMEFRKIKGELINGFQETIDIEDTYLFPLLKGSSIAKGKVNSIDRYILVPQQFIGQSTKTIQNSAPKTWIYLQKYANYLDNRKSKIYKKQPRFSIFGVGNYTFAPYKIAIAGLYKQLTFQLITPVDLKPVIFDDTVYFLAFTEQEKANHIFNCLTSKTAKDFYSCLIFWDEKRPIKSHLLNALNIDKL
ncbi:MAG: SAM-dependent methyltransferase [Microcystaceae cyanobacterium]